MKTQNVDPIYSPNNCLANRSDESEQNTREIVEHVFGENKQRITTPGGLIWIFGTALLSSKNIRQNKKATYKHGLNFKTKEKEHSPHIR